ncbi:cytochrome P450-dit2, partial [Ceratobasidium sp. 392]
MEFYHDFHLGAASAYVAAGALLICLTAKYLSKTTLNLDGPPNPSLLAGTGFNADEKNEELQEAFMQSHGRTLKYYKPFNKAAVYTSDPSAIHSVTVKDLAHFGRNNNLAAILRAVLGGGLGSMWGPKHRAHRKALNPVFVTKHLREQVGELMIFDDIALQACDAIARTQGVARGQSFECDVYHYMNASALELIGQAGLGYSFGSFTGRRDEYSAAIKRFLYAISDTSPDYPSLNLRIARPTIVSAALLLPFMIYFENFGTPGFRRWVADNAPFKAAKDLRELVRIQHDQAQEILSSRQHLLASGQSLDSTTGSGKDILTLLMKANEKLPEDAQMPPEEMIGHMNGAVTRVLDILANRPEIQNRLRAELVAFIAESGAEEIDRDGIEALPYLDAVCRETLRLHPPVNVIERVSLEDIVIPLKYPVNTSTGPQTSIFVPKGTSVSVGIYNINRDKDIWGPDAD